MAQARLQIPKLGKKVPQAAGEHVGTLDVTVSELAAGRPKWPAGMQEQFRLVRDVLAKAPAPAPADAIAAAFDGRNTPQRRARIAEVLGTMVATGLARTGEAEGQTRYFLPQ